MTATARICYHDSNGEIMAALTTQTITQTKSATIFQRIADRDRTAAADCVETYGNFIWALAKKFTASREEAEAATREIFTDIWQYSLRADQPQPAENILIALIARRRLIKHLQ